VEGLRALAGKRRLLVSAPGPLVAEFDADLVRRVVANLVTNAIKFSATDGEVRVALKSEGGLMRVEVIDNGRGIAPEQHRKIFEKFGQVEVKGTPRIGTGLGLTFARMAIEAHGGQIGVESAVGQGSTFWFTLPVPARKAV
jgi:signal transduction histidine kinase